MKLTFLGTSHGVIEAGRHCSSILLEVGENAFLIDGGAPVGDILTNRGIPFSKVKALFNTHFHDDHIFGSLQFLSLINWFYKQAEIDVYIPDVLGVKAIKDLLRAAEPRQYNGDRLRLHYYEDGFSYDQNGLSLRAIRTRHVEGPGRHSYAFTAEAEGKRVFFSGDMRPDFSDMPDVIYREHFDLAVIESAHQSFETLMKTLEGINADRVMINHIFVLEKKQPLIEAAAKTVPFDLRIARDDDVVEL